MSFSYEPNDIDSDLILSEMPLSLMKENITCQFEDPLEYRKKDHITTFLNMYEYSKDNVNAYEDEEIDNVVELRDDFYSFMQNLFEKYLGIGFVNFDDEDEETQNHLIHFKYIFFIINIKKNFICYILNFINDRQSLFVHVDEKKKDVTSMSFKKEITDPNDMYIIANLSSIIDMILSQDIDVDDFFENCDDDECLETRFVANAFDNMKLTGNFVENYIGMLDDVFKSEIESKVRNKILKKYKKK